MKVFIKYKLRDLCVHNFSFVHFLPLKYNKPFEIIEYKLYQILLDAHAYSKIKTIKIFWYKCINYKNIIKTLIINNTTVYYTLIKTAI